MTLMPSNASYSVKPIFTCEQNLHYVDYFNITRNSLRSPMKTKPEELASGRYLYNLAKLTLKNLRKAVSIAEEWLDNGDLSSGQTWSNLYA